MVLCYRHHTTTSKRDPAGSVLLLLIHDTLHNFSMKYSLLSCPEIPSHFCSHQELVQFTFNLKTIYILAVDMSVSEEEQDDICPG